jgi:hypothetical protein
MMRGFRPTRRIRLRLTLLAILALVCQQVAFAAYVCPATAMPAQGTAMSAACNAIPATSPICGTQAATTQCVLHSAQPATVVDNVQLPSVPPLLLPAFLSEPLSVAPLSAAHAAHARDAAQRTPALPPPLRYRVLLI